MGNPLKLNVLADFSGLAFAQSLSCMKISSQGSSRLALNNNYLGFLARINALAIEPSSLACSSVVKSE